MKKDVKRVDNHYLIICSDETESRKGLEPSDNERLAMQVGISLGSKVNTN